MKQGAFYYTRSIKLCVLMNLPSDKYDRKQLFLQLIKVVTSQQPALLYFA